MREEVMLQSGANRLDGTICRAEKQRGGVVFIAGGGTYTKELYREWQQHLANNGYSSMAFDFPGIGKSTGELSSTGLNSRLGDTEKALDYFINQTGLSEADITLCGRSMGGTLALRVADKRGHKKLILLYPAAYAAEAYEKNFDEEFTEVIRSKDSWVNSPDFELAEKYDGEILVIYGQLDEVIPKGIQDRYLEIGKLKGQSLVIKGAGHNKFLWEDDMGSKWRRHELFDVALHFLGA